MVLYEKIQKDPLEFPPEVDMCPGLRRLLRAMMEKDPANRIPLDQVESDVSRWESAHWFRGRTQNNLAGILIVLHCMLYLRNESRGDPILYVHGMPTRKHNAT